MRRRGDDEAEAFVRLGADDEVEAVVRRGGLPNPSS